MASARKDQVQIHNGWLLKKGYVNKSWKRRYFKLYSDGTMDYFNKDTDTKKKGTINLTQITRLEALKYTVKQGLMSNFKSTSGSPTTMMLDIDPALHAQPSTSSTTDDSKQNEDSAITSLSTLSIDTIPDAGLLSPSASLSQNQYSQPAQVAELGCINIVS